MKRSLLIYLFFLSHIIWNCWQLFTGFFDLNTDQF
uniref:Uncharacterized protein n=1 Tax=Rhizophora mucronata TaxID=61149 RepID=A0A2P2L6D6_RHIMU